MRKLYPVLFVCCFWLHNAHAQATRLPGNVAYLQLNTYTHHPDVFCFTANQAALINIHQFSAGVYGEKRFMLQELSTIQAVAVLPTASGNFGGSLNYFGNANYNEMQAALAYGKKLSEKVAAGVQFNYYSFQTAGYGQTSSVNAEAGLLFQFSDQVQGGIHLYNPTRSKLGKYGEEKLPLAVRMGFGYDASAHLFLSGCIEKQEDKPLNVQTGIQYQFDNKLLAKAGVATATHQYFFGVGVLLKDFRLDAIATVHPQLGLTPGLLLLFKPLDTQ